MSEEVKETVQEKGTSMYVHQVKYDTFRAILGKVTDVNKVFTYTMPNKAQNYANDGFGLISTLNQYINGDDDWRITKESNIKVTNLEDKIVIGDWIITGTKYVLCIPRINSIIIIPDDTCTYKGSKDLTKIIQLTNCIAVTPLLVRLLDEPTETPETFNLGMTYEMIIPKPVEEKPTE